MKAVFISYVTHDPDIELSVTALNPFSQRHLPIYVSSSHDFGEFLDSHLGVPSVCDGDRDVAARHGLAVTEVLTGDGDTLDNSGQVWCPLV